MKRAKYKTFLESMFQRARRNYDIKKFGNEELNQIIFSDTKEQYGIFYKAKEYVINWAKQNNVPLIEALFVPLHEFPSEIHYFYELKTDIDKYSALGISKKIEELSQSILKEYGYFEQYNDRVVFYFDSEENIKENYGGDYYLYLRA